MGFRFFGLAMIAAALPAWAGEFVVFSSGARLQIQRHEQTGQTLRLFHGSGFTEVPASVVAEFEVFEDVLPDQPMAVPEKAESAVAPVVTSSDPQALIREAALKMGLPPEFVASVAKVESAFRPSAVSPKGAIGVMQLMPETAKALGADPHDPKQNIEAGARLLRDLLLQYDGDVVKALSAYNAGPGAVAKYKGLPPYDETRRYVNKVIGAYQQATQGD